MRRTAIETVLAAAALPVAAGWVGWVVSQGTNQLIHPGWWAFRYAALLLVAFVTALAALLTVMIRPPADPRPAAGIPGRGGLGDSPLRCRVVRVSSYAVPRVNKWATHARPSRSCTFMAGRTNLIVAGGVLVLVGALLAGNVGGLADKGARLNARAGFLAVNSQANTWRFAGGDASGGRRSDGGLGGCQGDLTVLPFDSDYPQMPGLVTPCQLQFPHIRKRPSKA
jgi:hypothetical protein